MSLKCHIVKDLLPNYIEHLTSEETNQEIKSHLEQCSNCRNEFCEMNKPVLKIEQEKQVINKKEVNYLKKCSKIIKRSLIAIGVLVAIVVVIVIIGGDLILSGWTENEKVTNINHYSEYLGSSGKHSTKYLIRNDIFPDRVPESAKVEDFYYRYYNPFDPNYVAYLVYTCSADEYKAEVDRLSKLNSTKDFLIYSSKGFNYPVCAVYADNYGYIYALADKENNRLIYVEITFCNYFSDINYENTINKKYLPIGFDAKQGNATSKAFEESQHKISSIRANSLVIYS
jgi:hypothetical protein